MQLSFARTRPPRLTPLSAFVVALAFLASAVAIADERGYAGLEIRDIEQAEADALGWEAPRGAFVVALFEDGPALNAGVQAGDIVVSVDGTEVEGIEAFIDTISGHAPGARITLRLLREGKERRVTMVLAVRPASQPLPEKCAKFMPALGRSIEVACPDPTE